MCIRDRDEMEKLKTRGYFEETGNKVFFYISSVNFDTSYWCVQIKNYHISLIKTFILSSVASLDEGTYEKLRKWLRALIRSSIMIDVYKRQRTYGPYECGRKCLYDTE